LLQNGCEKTLRQFILQVLRF